MTTGMSPPENDLVQSLTALRLDARFDDDKDLAGHVDIKRLRSGKCGAVFLSTYVDWYVIPPLGCQRASTNPTS